MLLNCGVGEDSWESLHLKGDQSWVFIGRTDAKAETPIIWPPHVKSWLIGKDPDAGRDWGQEEKGTTEDEMVGLHHRLNGHEFEWTPGVGDGTGRPGMLWFMGLQRVGHDWVTKLNWTYGHHEMINTEIRLIIFFTDKDGEALYSQQEQDSELIVAQIMKYLLPN